MRWEEQDSLFRRAVQAYRAGRGTEAAALFRELVDSGSRDPKHLSYGGLVVATEQGDVKTGLAWCERALELAFWDPQMYVNLARLHERTGWKTQALQVLRKGLRTDPTSTKLLAELHRLNPRRPRAVPGLARSHPVNRYLGRLKAEFKTTEKARVKPKTSPSYS